MSRKGSNYLLIVDVLLLAASGLLSIFLIDILVRATEDSVVWVLASSLELL